MFFFFFFFHALIVVQLWVFSGRRGIHCWVADKRARHLEPDAREAIIDFMNILNGKGPLPELLREDVLHQGIRPVINWSYENVIEPFFEKYLKSQLEAKKGDRDPLEDVLSFIENTKQHDDLKAALEGMTDPKKIWETLVNFSKQHSSPKKLSVHQRIAFTFTYPRFDSNVTKGMNHLLKSPFSVHPGTGKISVPIDFDKIDSFDIDKVPTIEDAVDGEHPGCLDQYVDVLRRFVKKLSEDPRQYA